MPNNRFAPALGTDASGTIIPIGTETTLVNGTDFTVNIGNNTWGTTLANFTIRITPVNLNMSIFTWSMQLGGGIPPQSATNLFAYIEVTAISQKFKDILGNTSVKYHGNRWLLGKTTTIGSEDGYTGYSVNSPEIIECGFGNGYVMTFVFFDRNKGNVGGFTSQYTPNPWMGWGNIFTCGTSISVPSQLRHYIGGTGFLTNNVLGV